jgi:hypothetical protein
MTGHPGTNHTRIHPSHAAVVARLEEKYAHMGLRFDTGFAGSVPVQASGRIGRRFFYFRFRGDCASLTIGSPDHARDASQRKARRIKALRTLRHNDDSGFFGLYGARLDLKRDSGLARHPSIPVRYAVINDVTGERYNGFLEQDEAEALFVQLMESLVPARKPVMGWPQFRLTSKGQRSFPMEHTRGVIAKPANLRR